VVGLANAAVEAIIGTDVGELDDAAKEHLVSHVVLAHRIGAGEQRLARQVEQGLDGGAVENALGGAVFLKGCDCAHGLSENLHLPGKL
jgi:hypothetical protein